ncbi:MULTISPECIES: NeuD/PglB/VioB family sugar acetyltransferase [Corynebacterium]|nr:MULTISPECIES: NeuD/PglB/VioB family sugar acetyltransferase [Corynebacterium]KAA9222764.1 sugar O-acyltransferase [Corynebacterium amycolatum]MBC6762567.1 sugar O-acyltransferase [Corynebacterium sp. LK27]MBC6831167.1 sugar O-acyltransferase [Corynebacterium sp. LK29]MDK7145618.1 NeuD/PglB/VioB family sugar acetyltransferase [Corynebacterium amycolatum]MDK8727209.1 NeuD/PglB/VioB family sugar acetyltransferase [Corynebacterium amycolatum]
MPKQWINNTTTEKIVIVGAGGFGREVASHIRDINDYAVENGLPQQWEILGLIDDGTPDMTYFHKLGIEYLGDTNILKDLPKDVHYVVAIGNGAARRSIAHRADSTGLIPATLVHPDTTIGAVVSIGPGTVVCPGARITCNIEIGAHCQVHVNVEVGHDAVTNNFVSIFPLAAISGFVTLGAESTIGANSVINPGVAVGEGSYVGSGAAVNKDVPEYTLVAGVPAKVKKTLR